MNELVKVDNLGKQYDGQQVLDGVTFAIKDGELFSILGPNGAGKSTLISLILGLAKADSGEILLEGKKLDSNSTEHKSLISVVFQNSILDAELSVKDNLVMRAYFYTNNWKEAKKLAKDKLADVQGSHLLNKRYGVLSGGERRKVDIARALLNTPKLLFLDEPTTGLDIASRAEMWRLIHQLKEKYKMTVVLTTHYMEEARDSDNILMLSAGRILAYNSPEQLKEDYQCTTLEDVFLAIIDKGRPEQLVDTLA
ncbi:ABC transporter ATP-binding protein [Enterococcus sp. BWR-S5]|uniref:ABC transporter ATP-binding protein n=1 Tax=Enterococcus sp. BWR-S5 TaxID=2787714 RepID=UPI001920D361|nr:ABC transporter ATP-binding protein [Enterococcus sp. BWR-S5]MBL1227284.1 ABC transporter ATP-binding protein [Enterococcus sp. BWR-S5]